MVGRSLAYPRDQYHNSRNSGAISLLMVCGSMVLVQGRFCRQIGMEFCYRVGSQGILVATVIEFIAAADIGNSSLCL